MKKFIGCVIILGITLFFNLPLNAQETVNITLPTNISLLIANVNQITESDSITISYKDATLNSENYLTISIKANTDNFSRPSDAGESIAASNVSWTTSNAIGGSGVNGTLSPDNYNRVYKSITNPTSGSVVIVWKLALPGSGIRAGPHILNCTWKIESLGS